MLPQTVGALTSPPGFFYDRREPNLKQKTRLPAALVLLLILALAAALRLQHIRADPPPNLVHLTNSAGIYFDEAMYAHNARNKALFGAWMTDDWNPLLYNAVLTGIYYLGFKFAGVSIVSVKVITIVFGLLGVLFLYLAVRRYLSASFALGIAFLLAIDFYWTMYNRIGLLENFSTLIFIIGYYFLVKAEENPRQMVLVGVFAALAALSKYLFFYFVLSAGLAVAHQARMRKKWEAMWKYLAGVLAVFSVWFFSIFLPLASSFRKIGSGWMDLSWPESVGKVFFNIYRNNLHRYMNLIPVLFIAGLLFAAMVILKTGKRNPPPDIREMFVFLWIAGTFLQMAILNYQPLRYYLNIVPGLFIALSLAVKEKDWLRTHARSVLWVFIPLAALFYKFWIGLVKYPSAFFVYNLTAVRMLVYAAVILVFLNWWKGGRQERASLLFIAAVLAASSLTVYYTQFYRRPVYRVQSAANQLRQLPPGSVIMGNEAPRLGLETGFKLFPAFEGWFNDEDPFRSQRPTHLLTLDKYWGGEIAWIRRRFPEIAARLNLIRRFPLWDTTVSLYRVNYPENY
jgi:hypothetical protein